MGGAPSSLGPEAAGGRQPGTPSQDRAAVGSTAGPSAALPPAPRRSLCFGAAGGAPERQGLEAERPLPSFPEAAEQPAVSDRPGLRPWAELGLPWPPGARRPGSWGLTPPAGECLCGSELWKGDGRKAARRSAQAPHPSSNHVTSVPANSCSQQAGPRLTLGRRLPAACRASRQRHCKHPPPCTS